MIDDHGDPNDVQYFILGCGAVVFVICFWLAILIVFGLKWMATLFLVCVGLIGLMMLYTHFTTPKIDR
jgi:hypothetical protein